MLEQTIYSFNGLSFLSVSVICFYIFLSNYKNKNIITKTISILGILVLIPSYINLSWALRILPPNETDFMLIMGGMEIIVTILLSTILFRLTKLKNIIFLNFIYILGILGALLNIASFFIITSALTLVLLLTLSIELHTINRKLSNLLLQFTIFSSIIFILVPFYENISLLLWVIPNLSLMPLLFAMNNKKNAVTKNNNKTNSSIIFIRFILYIICLTSFIYISTITIHEMGHALTGNYYGCEKSIAVVFDIHKGSHTELICNNYSNPIALSLSGAALTLLIGLAFLIINDDFTKIISILIFGFSLSVLTQDLLDVGISRNITSIIIFIGYITIVWGVYRLSYYYLKLSPLSSEKIFKDRPQIKNKDEKIK